MGLTPLREELPVTSLARAVVVVVLVEEGVMQLLGSTRVLGSQPISRVSLSA
jgi:hypothetical protein